MTELDTMTADELIGAATKIIIQDGHEKKDIKELSKIRFFLSIQYKKITMLGNANEGLYNRMRAGNSVSKVNYGMTVGKAENEAKSEAETKYPNWRETNAEASGIGKLLATIEGFIINLQVEMKTIDQVYTGQ